FKEVGNGPNRENRKWFPGKYQQGLYAAQKITHYYLPKLFPENHEKRTGASAHVLGFSSAPGTIRKRFCALLP
ncbi:MAG: hypothetical protein R6W72_04100, partial [Desulfurivibrionaceae bacterium]